MRNLRTFLTLFLGLLFFPTAVLFAQSPGDLDHSFNPTDKGYSDLWGANGIVYSSALQPDGKYLVAGQFTKWNNQSANRIARINTDGTVDNSFAIGSGIGAIPAYTIHSMQLLSDGKILIGGLFEDFNGTPRNNIARINSDGTLDTTFNPGSGFNALVKVIEVQSNGKILVGGNFTSFNGSTVSRAVRLNQDGTLDASFSIGTGANAVVNTIATQTDGKVLLGGNFTTFNGVTKNRIVRTDSMGIADTTFNIGSGANNEIDKIIVQSDGKIAVVGLFVTYNADTVNRVLRLNNNGSRDITFLSGRAVYIGTQRVRTILQLANGQYYIGGNFGRYDNYISANLIRLQSNGEADTTFRGRSANSTNLYTVTTLGNGQLLLGGEFVQYHSTQVGRTARANSDGSIDRSFNQATGLNNWVSTTAVQEDGKILAGGLFSEYFGNAQQGIVRLHTDGAKDTTFNTGTGFTANSSVQKIILDTTGKIIVVGSFVAYNGDTVNGIVRLHANGNRDTTFNTGLAATNDLLASAEVNYVQMQQDGKFLLTGAFTKFNTTTVNHIVRLNTDGSVDPTFNANLGFLYQGNPGIIALDNTGKIYVSGSFNGFNGNTAYRRIIRLNTNGSLDTTFKIGTLAGSGGGALGPILPLADGTIIVGGSFVNSVEGKLTKGPFKFSNGGALDTTFTATINSYGGLGINSLRAILSLTLQSDGKIIVAGNFTTYNGEAAIRLMRINPNGSVDTTFSSGIGPLGTPLNYSDTDVRTVSAYPNDRIVIGGAFTSYNETGRNFIARVHLKECVASNGTDVQNICGGTFTWVDGITYTTDNNTATYTLVSGAQNGCDSVTTLNLTFTPSITASATISNGTLTANSIANASYQWINCADSTPITGATAPSYSPAADGSYAVTITSGACVTTSECYSVSGLSISHPNTFKQSISIYPNPTEALLNIHLKEAANYCLSNVLGVQLSSGKIVAGKNTVQVSELPQGVYLINITNSKNEQAVFKFVRH